MDQNMEQRRKVRQINVAREVLEGFGYEVIDPDEKEEGPEPPNGPGEENAGLTENQLQEVLSVLKTLRVVHESTRNLHTVNRIDYIIRLLRS